MNKIFLGSITSLKGTRGESLTFKYDDEDGTINLDVKLRDGDYLINYRHFLMESILLNGEVFRDSFYKKPRLLLNSMELKQNKLDL